MIDVEDFKDVAFGALRPRGEAGDFLAKDTPEQSLNGDTATHGRSRIRSPRSAFP